MNRPLCAFCKEQPVKQKRTKFCSTRCAGLAKRHSTRICSHCRTRRVRRGANEFCGRRCAVLARGAAGVAQLRREKVKAVEAQRVKYFERVKQFIQLEVDAVMSIVPEAERRTLMLVLMKAAIGIYRRGYKRGYTCAANRLRQGRAA